MKHFKSSLLAITVLLFSFTSNAQVTGDGNVIRQDRDVSDFTGISVSSGIDVFVTQGSATALQIAADKNLQDLIITEVYGDILKIYVKPNSKIRKSNGMDAYITVSELKSVEVNGGGDIETESLITTPEIRFDVSGGGDLGFNLASDKTICDVSGGGDVELKGKVGDFKVSISGGGDLELDAEVSNLIVDISGGGDADIMAGPKTGNVKISISGGGDLEMDVNAANLMTSISGGGDADISAGMNVEISELNISSGGNLELKIAAEKMKLHVSGGGDASLTGSAADMVAEMKSGSDLYADEFKVKTAMLKLSGGSDASLHVSGVLDVSASGGGQVKISGNPEIKNANLSGGSKLHTQ